jgi:hypothetical protein
LARLQKRNGSLVLPEVEPEDGLALADVGNDGMPFCTRRA